MSGLKAGGDGTRAGGGGRDGSKAVKDEGNCRSQRGRLFSPREEALPDSEASSREPHMGGSRRGNKSRKGSYQPRSPPCLQSAVLYSHRLGGSRHPASRQEARSLL